MLGVGLGLAALAGAGATGLLLGRRPGWLEGGALVILLGLGLAPLSLVVATALGWDARLTSGLVTGGLVLAGGARVAWWGQGRVAPAAPVGTRWTMGARLAAGLVLVVGALLAGVTTSHAALGWDGLFIWEFKARAICLADGQLPQALFQDPSLVWFQPHYPLLIPLAQSWLDLWAGACDQSLARLVGPLFLLAIACLLLDSLARLAGPWTGVLGVALLFTAPRVWIGDGSVSTAFADLAVAGYYLGAVVWLVRAWPGPATPGGLLPAGVLAALAVWSKQEGVLYWLLVGAAATVLVARRGGWPRLLWWALPGLVVAVGWRGFLQLQGTPLGFDFEPLTPATLLANADRLPTLGGTAAQQLADRSEWGLFWFVVVVALAIGRPWPGRWARLGLAWFVGGPLVLWAAAYVLSAWDPYTLHVRTSYPRLALQVLPTGALFLALWFQGLLARRPSDAPRPVPRVAG